MSVLVNGRLQFSQNRVYLLQILCGNRVGTEFPDAIIKAALPTLMKK